MTKEKLRLAAAHFWRWSCTLSVMVHDEDGYSFYGSGCSGAGDGSVCWRREIRMMVKRNPHVGEERSVRWQERSTRWQREIPCWRREIRTLAKRDPHVGEERSARWRREIRTLAKRDPHTDGEYAWWKHLAHCCRWGEIAHHTSP